MSCGSHFSNETVLHGLPVFASHIYFSHRIFTSGVSSKLGAGPESTRMGTIFGLELHSLHRPDYHRPQTTVSVASLCIEDAKCKDRFTFRIVPKPDFTRKRVLPTEIKF